MSESAALDFDGVLSFLPEEPQVRALYMQQEVLRRMVTLLEGNPKATEPRYRKLVEETLQLATAVEEYSEPLVREACR